MRKIIAIAIALTMIFSLCACGSDMPNSSDGQYDTSSNNVDDSSSAVNTEVQGISDEERLQGLWISTDTIEHAYMNCVFFSTDGYVYYSLYGLTDEDGIDCIKNVIACAENDKSSSAIEAICEYEYEEVYSIEDLYEDGTVVKYEIKDDKIEWSYSNGCKDIYTYCFNPGESMFDLVIKRGSTDEADLNDLNLIRYNYTPITFSYFVGNWNYKVNSFHTDNCYGSIGDYYCHSGSIFFGDNYRYNESDGTTGGWGYIDGFLELDGNRNRNNIIKLSQQSFLIHLMKEHSSEITVYTRA